MLRTKLSFSILIVALTAFTAVPVFAGDDDEDQDKDEESSRTHESDEGYSITPPEGWQAVSGELSDEELEDLPKSIREKYDPDRTDVMFMDLSTGEGFKDNVNVVVLEKQIPINEDVGKAVKKSVVQKYQKTFSNFELTKHEMTAYGDYDALRFEGSYELLEHKLYLYQALMSGPETSLVVTCTFSQSRKDERMETCNEVFNSIEFGG